MSKRERGTGRLFLRGTTWWCQYYHRGLQVRTSTDETDEKKAGKFLRKRLAEVETNTHSDSRNVRYEDLRASFLADYETNGRKSLRRDADGQVSTDAVNRLDEFFAGYRVREIDADAVRRFQRELRDKLSNATINRSVSALRRMFNLARKEGKLREVPYFPFLAESAARSGFIERAEFDKLQAALPAYLRVPVAIAFFCGMRRGEILSLRWNQVDFLNGTIRLLAGTTKNDEGRVVPIPAPLRPLLVEQHAKRQPECPFVCYRVNRRGVAMRLGNFRKAWASACKKAGLDGLLFHDLRRSAVRNLVRSGVADKTAMGISGHKTRAVFDRYNIVSENDVMDAGRKLAAFHEASPSVRPENGDKTGTTLHQNAAARSVVN